MVTPSAHTSEPRREPTVIHADLAIIDSQFPQAQPRGFRNAEFCEFLRRYSNVSTFAMHPVTLGDLAAHPHVLGVGRRQFRDNKAAFVALHPEWRASIRWLDPAAVYKVRLAYSLFLAETYALLPFYEANGIPFIFTLYPGGLFALHNPYSDAMLRRVCSSPQFRGVIATQEITRDYVLTGGFCPESRVTLAFGAIAQFRPQDVLPKVLYPADKSTVDICFVASKYSPQGYDKGYDLFVQTAGILAERDPCFRFHVVGDFGPDDYPLGVAGDRIHFHGPQMPPFLLHLYSRMDIFLSPNRPGVLVPGNFDGFPLGADLSTCGVARLVADELGINTHFRDRSELIVIPLEPEAIAQEIVALKDDPALMYAIGARGRARTEATCGITPQVDARVKLISQFVELRPRDRPAGTHGWNDEGRPKETALRTGGLGARARSQVLTRLPAGAVARARLLKWALTGAPSTVGLTPPKPAGPAKSAPKSAEGPTVLPPGKTRLQQRRECVLFGVDHTGSFLEIGPSHQPTLPRRDGYNTKNADHLGQSGLIEKYRGHAGVDLDAIEDVDYVLSPGVPLASHVDEQFDLILASHVLEHTTSLIDFVNDCSGLLKPAGTLAFIVPDQRFCFDRFRERTSLGVVIDAAQSARGTHSAGTLTEFALYATKRKGSISWGPGSGGAYEWVHGLDDARDLVQAAADGSYIDVHHWVFTPHHLRLLLHDLADTGHIALRESFFHDTVGNEFFLSLKRDGGGPRLSREDLVGLADAERQSYGRARFGPPAAGQKSAGTADQR